jgi:hypothetical protein
MMGTGEHVAYETLREPLPGVKVRLSSHQRSLDHIVRNRVGGMMEKQAALVEPGHGFGP